MNLTKLFETQRILDARIMEKHLELVGQNNIEWKILALQVELAECANEWRGFKKWSNDQEPRLNKKVECFVCDGTGDENFEFVQEDAEGNGGHEYIHCENCEGTGYDGTMNPLLVEYVDCLHFILSIGIEINKTSKNDLSGIRYPESTDESESFTKDDVIATFSHVFKNTWNVHADYRFLVAEFMRLGNMLGFTWEQIEQAYYDKNAINHTRQDTGY